MIAAVVLASFIWAITSSTSGPEIVTHDCAPCQQPRVSPSLSHLTADRRLLFARTSRSYRPSCRRSPSTVFIALMLILGGVETNPGPPNVTSSPASATLRLGVLNVRSAVNKTAMLHDVISDLGLDLFAVTETWMKTSHPPAITHGIAPTGYRVLHGHRANDEEGGGVALVYNEQLQVTAVSLASTVTGADCLVTKLRTRRGRLNIAITYRPPTSSPKHGISVTQFCSEFSELLDELLALPGELVVCGDFNCPGQAASVDERLLEVLESRDLVQRVDRPTHQDGNTLDLLIDLDGSNVVTEVRVVDAGLSDHFVVLTDLHVQRPKAEVQQYSFRRFRAIDPDDFAANLQMTDVYINPADNVDGFCNQIQLSVTNVLDALAPVQTRTKRRGKRSSRWLSEAAVAAKQNRRRLERRWKKTGTEADRVAYRAACRAASAEINASRSAFYTNRLEEVAGDHRATWRITKELLHSDDRPPVPSRQDAAKLCDGFCRFFADKLLKIADTVTARLSATPAYHRQPEHRDGLVCPLDHLAAVTVDEVAKVIRLLPSKSSPVDFMPTSLLKSTVDVMAPLITRLANMSFSTGVFPSPLKQGRVTPLLKKSGLDQSDMANYRPITNLSSMSKILEKLAIRRLRPHVMSTGRFSECQSAYRLGHSTETALLKVVNDVVTSACDRQTTVLLSLDISAAFDSIDHDILLDRLGTDFGISGSALGWLRSFVVGRTQYVAVGTERSPPAHCTSGVPQGSVLGPLLFAMYISPMASVVAAHGLCYHQYADDTQLYMSIQPQSTTEPFRTLSLCVDDVCRWFLENSLLLNPSKTEAVLFGTRIQRSKVATSDGIDVAGTSVPFRDKVKLLGVTLDSALSMDRHVTEVVRNCNYHIRALRHIRPLLTPAVTKMLAHSIVTSRFDYANALLSGTTSSNLDRLQVVQNSLARVVCQAPRSASATELRRQLHWLPVRQRIAYKLATITYRTRSTGTPLYLAHLIKDYHPSRTLRSADKLLLSVPRTTLALSAKAFSVCAPSVWNSLSYNCRSADSYSSFRRALKTELFDSAYSERKHST